MYVYLKKYILGMFMKFYTLVAIALINSSCMGTDDSTISVKLEGNSSQGANVEDSESGGSGGNASGSIETPPVTNIEKLYDFSDPSLFSQDFTFTYNGGITANLNDTMPGTNSAAFGCNSNSSTSKACYQESNDTFNLPITIQFDFAFKNIWYTESGLGLCLYDTVDSFNSKYTGWPTSGSNLAGIFWRHTYGSLGTGSLPASDNRTYNIYGTGLLSNILYYRTDQKIADKGKIKLEIDANGAYTYSFLATDGSLLNSQSGTLVSLPTNFKIRFIQTNYGNGYSNYIDNIKIIYQ